MHKISTMEGNLFIAGYVYLFLWVALENDLLTWGLQVCSESRMTPRYFMWFGHLISVSKSLNGDKLCRKCFCLENNVAGFLLILILIFDLLNQVYNMLKVMLIFLQPISCCLIELWFSYVKNTLSVILSFSMWAYKTAFGAPTERLRGSKALETDEEGENKTDFLIWRFPGIVRSSVL